MKIRTGFVSNSSSSSFLIYGIYGDSEELLKDSPRIEDEDEDEDGNNWDGLYDKLDALLNDTGLECHFVTYDDGSVYVGASWDTVGDNETGLQFKSRVEAKIKELFGDKLKCSTFEEAWRDG
jgi:hypothetical protein